MRSVATADGTIAGSGAAAMTSLAGGKTGSAVAILVSSAGAGARRRSAPRLAPEYPRPGFQASRPPAGFCLAAPAPRFFRPDPAPGLSPVARLTPRPPECCPWPSAAPALVRRSMSPAQASPRLGHPPGRRSAGQISAPGATRHVGVLANSSWAARSRAAAPSPNTRTDIDSTIAASRKRKPGSMDTISAFAVDLGRLLEPWERGDHTNLTGFATRAAAGALRIRLLSR